MSIGFWAVYQFQILIPIILPTILFLLSCAVLAVEYKRNPKLWDDIQKRKVPHPFEKALSLFIFIITALYTALMTFVLAPFRCLPQSNGTYTLIPNPSENCFDEKWRSHMPFIAFGLLQIVVIPICLIGIYSRHRRNQQSNFYRWRYGLLFRAYKDEFYWWELVIVIRKTAFVFLVDATNDLETPMRFFVIMVFLTLNFALESICRPYRIQGIHTISSFW
jgi:hypothetical protein